MEISISHILAEPQKTKCAWLLQCSPDRFSQLVPSDGETGDLRLSVLQLPARQSHGMKLSIPKILQEEDAAIVCSYSHGGHQTKRSTAEGRGGRDTSRLTNHLGKRAARPWGAWWTDGDGARHRPIDPFVAARSRSWGAGRPGRGEHSARSSRSSG